MKKILKKLGVISLLIAFLIPFVNAPKVDADDNYEYHLQNYLFLDMNSLGANNFFDEDSDKGSYTGINGYVVNTVFPLVFPKNATIESVDVKNIYEEKDITDFFNNYNLAVTNTASVSYKSWKVTGEVGAVFVKPDNDREYVTQTVLLHGKWNNQNNKLSSDELSEYSPYAAINKMTNYILPKILLSKGANPDSITADVYANNTSKTQISKAYLQSVIDELDSARNSNGSLSKINKVDDTYLLPITISRKIEGISMNSFVFGYKTDNGTYAFGVCKGSADNPTSNCTSSVLSSYNNYYDAFNQGLAEAKEDGERSTYIMKLTGSSSKLDFDVSNESYYWPVVMSVVYKVPKTTVPQNKWRLRYNANTDDVEKVTNVPAAVDLDLGKPATVANGPSRTGFKFIKWCDETKKNCYNPGQEYKSPSTSTEITLYAQWEAIDGTKSNPGTGIASYVISFIAVGAISYGIYYLTKKKNLFKQI